MKAALAFHPLTADRWDDLVRLFGPRGACGGCWCMVWRLPIAATMESTPDPFVWRGTPSAYAKAGFREAARRSRTRPIMRKSMRALRRRST